MPSVDVQSAGQVRLETSVASPKLPGFTSKVTDTFNSADLGKNKFTEGLVQQNNENSAEKHRMIVGSNDFSPPKPKSVRETSEAIVHVLNKYRLSQTKDPGDWPAKPLFLKQVEKFVSAHEPIHLLLPAFPFKSPNKTTKVLGILPDAGEEVALMHLNGFAAGIADVYRHGARILIISDGLMYNDILGVEVQAVWDYGKALRQIAKDHDLAHLDFARLHDLGDSDECNIPLSEEYYLHNASRFRDEILKHVPASLDVEALLATDPDTTQTYRGYIKFLELDLASPLVHKSKSKTKRDNEQVAKQMIVRGVAFRSAIAEKYPDYIRLSIHPSTETSKLSMSLIPQNGRAQTPWHSSLVRAVDGSITMSYAAAVSTLTHELIFENGRPKYFREKSDLYDWPCMDLNFNYMYPTGIMITAKDHNQSYSLRDVPMQKLRKLATQCSPVVLRGFKDTTDEKVFASRAFDFGVPDQSRFGLKISVKVPRGKIPTESTVSSEAMPMHFDGFVFLIPAVNPDGTTKMISPPPRFQYFSAITPSTRGSGYTLFASSPLFFKNLPAPHTTSHLKSLHWGFRHLSAWNAPVQNVPLVTPHPDTNEDCLRYLESWPEWKSNRFYNRVTIDNGPQSYTNVIEDMLYDHRVTLRFAWSKGDILVSDNIKMLHTRTAFDPTEDRELWRIHIN